MPEPLSPTNPATSTNDPFGGRECAESSSADLAALRQRLFNEAARLQGLADRVETFIREQCERMERMLADFQTASQAVTQNSPGLGRMGRYVANEPSPDEEQLLADALLLQEAWRQLEAERRQLLTERQAMPQMYGGPAMIRTVPEAAARPEHSSDPAFPARGVPATDRPPPSHERKMLEFQQLRRDLQRKERTPHA